MPVFLALFALSTAHAEEPPCEATQAQVQAITDDALDAFLAMDVEVFHAERTKATRALGCLREPLTPEAAASWHRLLALSDFLARDTDAATARFKAARLADPAARLPEEIAPAGHPLTKLYDAADPQASGAIEPLIVPESGRAYVDGSVGAVRPIDRPSVLQLAGPEGRVVQTRDLVLGASAPDWSGVQFNAAPVAPVVDIERQTGVVSGDPADAQSARPGILAVAGVTGLAGGASFAAASASRSRFLDPSTPFEDLEALRGRTNGLVIASGVAVAATVGLTAAAFTVPF